MPVLGQTQKMASAQYTAVLPPTADGLVDACDCRSVAAADIKQEAEFRLELRPASADSPNHRPRTAVGAAVFGLTFP
jgi:hypothetical protein